MDKKELQLKLKRVERELEMYKKRNEELTREMKDLKRAYRYNTMTLLNECNQILTKQAFEVTNNLACEFMKHVNFSETKKYKPKDIVDSNVPDDEDDENGIYRYGQTDFTSEYLRDNGEDIEEEEDVEVDSKFVNSLLHEY